MTPLRCTGKHCLDGPEQDGQPMPRWSAPGTMLCRRCTRTLERHLAELSAREQLVRANLARAGSGDGRGSGDLPLPINPKAQDHLDRMQATIVSWALLVREERGLRGPDISTVATLAPWLLGQLDWLVTQPWVDDLADELRDLTHVANSIARLWPHRTRLEPPCPRCTAQELGRWDGTAQVDCGACGATWDEKYLPALVRLALDSSRGCVTAREAAAELGVTVPALRQLVRRGQIRKLGTVDGQARYSTGDLDRLKQQRQEAS